MPYQVLARKWRPQTFAEVVGQGHISRTLRNAIRQGRIGHAYLFVGSRGIGKTTSARIFAKALNCLDNQDGEPCCQCECCLQAAQGAALDIIEIDGASHNRVEHIRDIRENVQYAPAKGKYKIYIIDEVHMLTPQAWNALLKTLEEPPAHVKFLFATTEPHKVLPTIISRCQRFDLKRIPVPLIVQRLRQIADGEKIAVDDAALLAIARAADGGMRDAQSIFDQMIAFCGGLAPGEQIGEQDVIDVFGLASGLELREIAAGIFTNDLNRSLLVLHGLADAGRDLERVFADLIIYVRNVMVVATCRDAKTFLEVSDTELEDLLNIGRVLEPLLVQRVLQGLVSQEWTFRSALNKRIQFETVLARLMLEAHSVQIDDIFTQLNRLSGNLPQEEMPPPKTPPAIPPATPKISPPANGQMTTRTRDAAPETSLPKIAEAQTTESDIDPATPPAAMLAKANATTAAAIAQNNEIIPATPEKKDDDATAKSMTMTEPEETESMAATEPVLEVMPVEELVPEAVAIPGEEPAKVAEADIAAADDDHHKQLPTETRAAAVSPPANIEPPAELEAASQDAESALTTANLLEHLARAADTQEFDEELDDGDGRELDALVETAARSLKSDDVVRRLSQALQASGEPTLASIVKKMTLLSFPQDTLLLTLEYDLDTMLVNDLLLVQDAQTQAKLRQAMRMLWPQANLKLQANESRENGAVRANYRPATAEEEIQLAANPFVQKVIEMFGAVVVEARIKTS